MNWSHYSEALFEKYLHSDENIIVQACPGAGKTTNVKHIWGLDDKRTVYLVFNKANQVEAEGKLPRKNGSDVLTLNGLGHRVIMRNFGSVALDANKVSTLVKNFKGNNHSHVWKVKRERNWNLIKAVNTAKMFMVDSFTSVEQYDAMVTQFNLEDYSGMQMDVENVLSKSDDITNVIDYNDQIRFPAIYQLAMPSYQVVLGDEVQDFSPIQARMISKLGAQRYVLVGDKHQSMYAFRGAMNNSMSVLKDMFKCTEMPLSITYRCGKNIVKEARVLFSDIEEWSEADEGIVRRIEGEEGKEDYTQQDMVVCRMNRPLIAMAYRLLQQGIACHVRGRNIGDGLITLVKKQEASNVRELIGKLQEWFNTEYARAQAKEDEAKIEALNDKHESLSVFIEKCRLEDSTECVIQEINRVFEQGKGVVLSTVHRAKGLEADRCFMLMSELHDMFIAKAKRKEQKEQERNIKYVAITRAKNELVYM